MRHSAKLCLTVAALVLAAGCGKKGGDTGSSAAVSIEGTYVIVGLEATGQAVPDTFFAKAPEAERTIRLTADKLLGTKDGKEIPSTYKTDPTKTPNEIDIVGEKDDGTAETMYGIYKIEGDTLTICMRESAKATDRPKEFKTTAENKALMMTLKKK